MISEYIFSGFEGTLKNINGEYGASGRENHDKPVYTKIGTNDGSPVMIYFWDKRDGDNQCGWWVAPEVGGADVWAMNPIASASPPTSGWKVPWNAGVNTRVTCMPTNKRGADGADSAAKKAKDFKSKTMAQVKRDDFDKKSTEEQEKYFEDRLKTLQSQARHLVHTGQQKLADVKNHPDFKTFISDIKNLSKEEIAKRTSELDRHLTTIIRQLQTCKLATGNKIMEAETLLKEAKFQVKCWPVIKAKLQKYVRQCEESLADATDWKSKKDERPATRQDRKDAVELAQTSENLVGDLEKVLHQTEADVTKLRDAAGLIQSEFMEMIPLQDLSRASTKCEVAIAAATRSVQAASLAITQKIPLFKHASTEAFKKFRVLQAKIPMWNEDIQKIQKLSLEADKRIRELEQKDDRQKMEMKRREKEKRFIKWNQNMIDDGWAEVYVVNDLLQQAEWDPSKSNVQRVKEAQLMLEKTIEDFIMKKDASNKTREILSTTMGEKIKELRKRVMHLQKQISETEFAEIQERELRFSGKCMDYLERMGKTPEDVWLELAKGSDMVTTAQIRGWCEVVVHATKEEVSCAMEHADCPRPTVKNSLSMEEFPQLFALWFEACDGAMLIEGDGSDNMCEVPTGTLVELIGLPNGYILPVRAVHGEGQGYLDAEQPGWARVSPFYECMAETILTDDFKMNVSFQMLKRIKVGEKLRIINPPRVDEDTGVTRMRAQCMSDGKIGYVTIVKPGGPEYLRADPLVKEIALDGTIMSDPHALDGVHCVEGEPIEAMQDGEWTLCHLGKCMGASSTVEVFWSNETKGKVARKDIRCRGTATKIRLSQWSLADFVGRIIKRAYDDIKKIEVPKLKIVTETGELLKPEQIRAMGSELEKKAALGTRILDELHEFLKEKAQEAALREQLIKDIYDVNKKFNKLMGELNHFRFNTHASIQAEILKARQAELDKENSERREMEGKLQEEHVEVLQKGTVLVQELEALCDEEPDKDASLKELSEFIKQLEELEKEITVFLDKELANGKQSPPCAPTNTLIMNLLTLQRRVRNNNATKMANTRKNVDKRLHEGYYKLQANALIQIREVMCKTYPNTSYQEATERMFERLCTTMGENKIGKDVDRNESSSSSSEEEQAPVETLQVSAVEKKRFEREFFAVPHESFASIRSLPWPLTKEQFVLAFLALARVTGTESDDKVEIMNDGVVIATVEPYTLLEVVSGAPEEGIEPEESALTRVRIFYASEIQNAMPANMEKRAENMEGDVPTRRLRMLSLKYEITKETVLTNKAELTQLKVLARLKKGDKVLSLGYPTMASNLLRMRAKIDDGTVGWLSLMGNNVDFVTPTSWL